MMERGQSLKRRRGWLLAGCSLLAAPVQSAAWPSWGTLWPSLPPEPQSSRNDQHPHHNHHGTAPAAAAEAAERPQSLRGGRGSPSRTQQGRAGNKAKKQRTTIPLPSRVLEVAIAVQGRHGDWDACSAETCTQTRLVFCETLDSRIVVSNDLCGEELPAAERECTGADVDAVCGGGGGGGDAAGIRNSAAGGSTQKQRSGNRSGAGSAAVGEEAGGSDERKTGDSPKSEKGKEAPSAVPWGGGKSAGKKSAASSKGGKEKEEAAVGPALEGSAPRDDAAGKSSRQQDETPAASTNEPADHMLAAKQQPSALTRMGGPGSNRAQYRFWLVMAIGAAAVGSFLAVVVIAVGQYRKERHRLRGIMALNDFPQDNYINPFAKQLSSDLTDDDRSAFKL